MIDEVLQGYNCTIFACELKNAPITDVNYHLI